MDISIRKLDRDQIINLKDFVDSVIKLDPGCNEFLQIQSTRTFFNVYNDANSICYGAFEQDSLIGYFIVGYQVPHAEFVAHSFGIEEEDVSKCTNIDSFLVDPEYRGYGLQKKFLSIAQEDAKIKGSRYMLVAVDSRNKIAINNFTSEGFKYAFTRKEGHEKSYMYFYIKEF